MDPNSLQPNANGAGVPPVAGSGTPVGAVPVPASAPTAPVVPAALVAPAQPVVAAPVQPAATVAPAQPAAAPSAAPNVAAATTTPAANPAPAQPAPAPVQPAAAPSAAPNVAAAPAVPQATFQQAQPSGDIVLAPSAPTKSPIRRIPPVFIIVGLMAIAVVVILIITTVTRGGLGGKAVTEYKSPATTSANGTSLSLIFDPTAPIPVEDVDGYGYMQPDKNEWAVEPKFTTAERFYGDYAAVTYLENGAEAAGLTNRQGEVVLKRPTWSYDQITYQKDYGFWTVGGVVYNNKLEALTPENSFAEVVGRNVFAVIPDVEDGVMSEGDWKPYFMTTDSDKTYECAIQNCRYNIFAAVNPDTNVYAIMDNSSRQEIVNLSDGSTVYTVSKSTNRLQSVEYGLLAEIDTENGQTQKYLLIFDGKIAKQFHAEEMPEFYNAQLGIVSYLDGETEKFYDVQDDEEYESVEESWNADVIYDKYQVYQCEDGLVEVVNVGGSTENCQYEGVTTLPDNMLKEYNAGSNGANPVILTTESENILKDLTTGSVIKKLPAGSPMVYDNGMFAVIQTNDGKLQACNIFVKEEKCGNIGNTDQIVDVYGNYLTVAGLTGGVVTYNYNTEAVVLP